MSKKAKETAIHQADYNGEQQVVLRQRTIEDDSPLPTPQELAQYQALDPTLIKFFVDQANLEQRHRHEAEIKQIDIIQDSETQQYRVNIAGLKAMVIVHIVTIALCGWSLYLGYEVIGSILAGVEIMHIAIPNLVRSFRKHIQE